MLAPSIPVSSPTHVLGPLDQLTAPVPVAVVYLYDHAIDAARLETALSHLVNYYPHLSGRLHYNPSDNTPEIHRIGEGMRFVTATANEDLEIPVGRPLLVTDLPSGGNPLFVPFDMSPTALCRDPVFSVQHTTFPDGKTALGIRILHILGDAFGFFQLVQDLAELYRNRTGTLVRPPCTESYLAGAAFTDEERKEALAYTPSGCKISSELPQFASPASPPRGRVVHVPTTTLAKVKTAATSPGANGWVSTFEALSAFLYRRIYHARQALAEPQPHATHFLTPVNLRPSNRLDLPPRYFPNALTTSTSSPSPDFLASASLPEVAAQVHSLVRSLDPIELERSARWVAAQPDKRVVRGTFPYDQPGFLVSQWSAWDQYDGVSFSDDVDARPLLASTPFTAISEMNGLAYYLRPRDGLGLDINIALCEDVWEVLDRDGGLLGEMA
ncbi:hypothetical protein Rhopal_003905-T1 [Rhodotorula paludigena]|uniref:Uncharacterized protein n=1 Tax=Rhodotorula paludigena TaxID=86838 RepID=A0AAV5GEQ9_9BASI|nr:hypothetical protein Rhopal_003905-T1 [Rhodotorula paludigena]